MLEQRIRIGEGGKITIPASLRQALGVKSGDELVMHLDHGELRLVSRSNALTRLRAAVKGTYDSPAENPPTTSSPSAGATLMVLGYKMIAAAKWTSDDGSKV